MRFRVLLVAFFISCAAPRQVTQSMPASISALTFLDVYELSYHTIFNNTTVGGLSGIEYDHARNIFYIISDDRSAINPARFYTADIHILHNRIDTVQFLAVDSFRRADGSLYPPEKIDALHNPDPESIRYNARRQLFVWSSEGERVVQKDKIILEDPAIFITDRKGRFVDSFLLPAQLHMKNEESGPRRNGVLEGLAFNHNYSILYASVEEPLYDDGPRAGTKDSTGLTRILAFDWQSKKTVHQYAYRIEPVAYIPVPGNAFKINGVPEILFIGKNRLLVMERSFSTGRAASTIRLYIADLNGATDIAGISSLSGMPAVQTLQKKLLLNMDTLGIYTDNVEGICIGPVLPNGHQTLLMVSDNNFSPLQKTQFFLFEIIP